MSETSRPSVIGAARTFIRERGLATLLEFAVNFGAPLLIYDLSRTRLGDVHALMASSVPPIAWSLIEFIRKRRVDALSIIVLAGIALSLLAFFGGGGAKFLQLREKLVTAIIGLAFVVSVLIRRPLIFYLATAGMRRRGQHGDLEMFHARRDDPGFKRVMNLMTLVWGASLLADAALGCVLVMSLSVHDYLIAGPFLGYGVFGGLSLWTFWYARRARRRGEARRAAEAPATSEADHSVVA
ncbi:MAG TPA: VC0807 family protein [Caulobacteraceae bacterium]